MTKIQFLYARPTKKIKYYFVVSHYQDDKVFWYGSAGCAGWTSLEEFVNCVNRGECKTVVITATEAIDVLQKAFEPV